MSTYERGHSFFDNLISLKAELRQQTAGWTPGAPVHSGLGYTLHADEMIPVADRVALSADICRPGRTGRYPAVVLFSAYSQQLQSTGAPTGTNESGEGVLFPIPHSRQVRFHLASADDDAQTHQLSDRPGDGSNTWGAVPFGAIVPPALDEVANPMLTYETKAADSEIEYAGPVTLSLRFSCSDIDSHVVARLGRVDVHGGYHLLSTGSIRPALRRIDETRGSTSEIAIDMDRPEPLVPGEPVTLRFSLTPHPVVLVAGERLHLDIASRTDLLRSDVSHGYEQFDMVVPPYFSRNTIHYGEETYVEVMQVGSDRHPAAHAAAGR